MNLTNLKKSALLREISRLKEFAVIQNICPILADLPYIKNATLDKKGCPNQ